MPAQAPGAAVASDADACANLSSLKLDGVKSIVAERVADGFVEPPKRKRIYGLPAFCRVHVIAVPGPQSFVQIELWLPEAGWNGRFLGTGNGGGAGNIALEPLGAGLKRNFAVANTDLGTSPSANVAVGLPDRWADFGYRATHVMTLLSKEIIYAYYGHRAQESYFYGCSTGGQQALSEAQRFPNDYNGIIAGAPANNRTHLHSEFLWDYQSTHKVEGKSALTEEQIAQLTRAVVAECAGNDGGALSDKFLTDPRICKFNPKSLPKCSADMTAGCFRPEQIAAIEAIYAGPTDTRTGERIYAPFPFGAEASGLGLAYQQDTPSFTSEQMYPFLWAFGSGFDPMRFDFGKDEETLDRRLANVLNANNPDLTGFEKAGGKLIMFTGTADPIVPFPDAVDYYERVVNFEGRHSPADSADPLRATQSFFRYYLVPGMGHCGGGPGLQGFGQGIAETDDDLLHDLEQWAEHDKAPETLHAIGSNGGGANSVKIERDLCPYPQFPEYTGGDPAARGSFQCKDHARGKVAAPGFALSALSHRACGMNGVRSHEPDCVWRVREEICISRARSLVVPSCSDVFYGEAELLFFSLRGLLSFL